MTLEDHLIQACRQKSLIEPDATQWILPIIVDGEECGLGIDQTCRNIRAAGGEMSPEEKKILGLKGHTKIGWTFHDALTALGKQDPVNAVIVTIHAAMFGWSREKKAQDFRRFPNKKVRVSVVMDDRTCGAAKKLHGKVYDQNAAPHFPLPDCDAEICRCYLGLYYERIRGKVP